MTYEFMQVEKVRVPIGRLAFTNIGKRYTDGKELEFKAVITGLEWLVATNNMSLPAMPGLAIKQAIQEFKLMNVKHISFCCREFAPYGFYGIHWHTKKQGDMYLFIMDDGCNGTPIASIIPEIK